MPAVASVLLVALVRERVHRPVPRSAGPVPRGAGRLPRRFWRATAVLVTFSLINFPDALLLLRLREIGFSVAALILAYVTYNAVYAAASFPAGLLADRWRPPRVFGLGLVFFAAGYLGLGLVHSRPAAWALLAGYGLFTACTDGVGKAWVSRLVDCDAQQGRAQGVYQALSGLGVLGAGVWAGLAWHTDGRLPLLVSGTVAAVLAVTLLATAGRRDKQTGVFRGRGQRIMNRFLDR